MTTSFADPRFLLPSPARSAAVLPGAEAWLPALERAGVDTTADVPSDLAITRPETAAREAGGVPAVIIEGELTARIGFEKFLLRQGDSLAFDATIPHQFWNQGSRRVRAVFVMTDRRS